MGQASGHLIPVLSSLAVAIALSLVPGAFGPAFETAKARDGLFPSVPTPPDLRIINAFAWRGVGARIWGAGRTSLSFYF
jgi:hypothetical protein